jgi:hypothetical protein
MTGKDLDVFVGRWQSRGHTLPTPGLPITGTDEYEWFPGDGFLVHHVDVTIGEEHVRVIEFIGDAASPEGGPYPMRSFDNQGVYSEMTATVDDGVWTFAYDSARATVRLGADRMTMTAFWERSDDGQTWQPWMEMSFARAT